MESIYCELPYASSYVKGYSAKVFGESQPSAGNDLPYHVKNREELIRLGEQDALADARNLLRKSNHPQANGTDQEVIELYKSFLVAQDGGNAKKQLGSSLEKRYEQMVGL